MTDNHLEMFKRALEEIAAQEHKHPRFITRDLYDQYDTPGISKTTIQTHLNGFTEARDAAFPPDSHELSTLDLYNSAQFELIDIIAKDIKACSEMHQLQACDITYGVFTQYVTTRYGKLNCKLVKQAIEICGDFTTVRDAAFPPQPTKMQIERFRIKEHASMNRALNKVAVDQEYTLQRLEELARQLYTKAFNPTICCKQLDPQPCDRVLNLMISDTHFGADIKASETGVLNFGIVEEARRLAHIVKKTAEYKREHRQRTKLKVLLLGDMIQGKLHDTKDGAAIAIQLLRANHILIQAIQYLSANFPEVEVLASPGNHDRMKETHKSRAVNEKWDSYMWNIVFAIKYGTANLPNVTFKMPTTPYLAYDALGHKIFATHGDTVVNLGNPHQSIRTAYIQQQLQRVDAIGPFSAFCFGHVHFPANWYTNQGSAVFTNGSLDPVDAYSISLGSFDTATGQWLFETTAEEAIADSKFITVGVQQDLDASLDQIIMPCADEINGLN